MEKILINTSSARSEIRIGENWENVKDLLPSSHVVIITDDNVNRLYGKSFPPFPVLKVRSGEGSKTLQVVEHLAKELLDETTDRSGFILAIGGGVVCDLAGFLASIYLRGIRCGYVSTTLLSQVDASTGGKNGVNLGGYKNILGNIMQPEFVICDPTMLSTLPEDEFLSGLAEMIKTAIIGDHELFELIEKHSSDIMRRDPGLMELLISRSVRYKATVVSQDEREQGLRRILNFGHTFGHAVEVERSLKHGFAVAYGMQLAAEFSVQQGLLEAAERDRIISLLNRFHLLKDFSITPERMEEMIMHDKKKSANIINFVFTGGIGTALYKKMSVEQVTGFYKRYIESHR